MSENKNNANTGENAENPENPASPDTLPEQREIQTAEPRKSGGDAFSKFKESILGTALILGMITLVMGFMLAGFNSMTAPAIEERMRAEMEDSIIGFFGGGVEFEYIDFDFAEPVMEAVEVKEASSQKFAGYCVTVAPRGFSGHIVMLVAINANITVRGTKILEMSETAGIGTKIENESWFAEQFKSKPRNIAAGRLSAQTGDNAIDTISGATKSSKAFLAGVNAALDAAYEMKNKGADAPRTTGESGEFGEGETIEGEEILDE